MAYDDTQNHPLWGLQLVVETFGRQSKFKILPKVVEPANKKTLL